MAKKNYWRFLRLSFQKRAVAKCALLLLVSLPAFAFMPGAATARETSLIRSEQDWPAAPPIFTIAPDPTDPPIEFFDSEHRYQGLAADYLHLIEQKLGIRFQLVPLESWEEAPAKAGNGNGAGYPLNCRRPAENDRSGGSNTIARHRKAGAGESLPGRKRWPA